MNNLLLNIGVDSVASQIASLLNSHNKLQKVYTSSSIKNNGTVYIIELGGFNMRHGDGERKIIGCVGLSKISNDVTMIKHLCVHESYRRQGVAKSLLDRAIKLCNTDYIQMKVRHDNNPSLHLAEDFGFTYVYHENKPGYAVLVLGRRTSDIGQN